MNLERVIKRDGSLVSYDRSKIYKAIVGANNASVEQMTERDLENIIEQIESDIGDRTEISVEDIQDVVERRLMQHGFFEIAKKYICYRYKHMLRRESKKNLMQTYKDILFTDASAMDDKRENANINTDGPMGIMLKLGSDGAKEFALNTQPKEFAEAHRQHFIHEHDNDFSMITLNCCQIDLLKLFHGGFSTGHGHIREPGSIRSYAALACVAIQSDQNDCFGGQSLNAEDYAMAEGIRKTFVKEIISKTVEFGQFVTSNMYDKHTVSKEVKEEFDRTKIHYVEDKDIKNSSDYWETIEEIWRVFCKVFMEVERNEWDGLHSIYEIAKDATEEETRQAMEAMVYNFNSLHARSGGQVPFSSINFGMDTSPEGRLAIRETLNAIDAGMGKGESPLFPISIFQIKSGINFNPGDPNYDLFKRACEVSAKRLYPNFVSCDATFNLKYYKPGNYNTYAATMGCRTRVIGNVNGPEETGGRGNFSFVTLNLPKFALEAKRQLGNNAPQEEIIKRFYEIYDHYIQLSHDYLLYRFQIIADKHVFNFPFLMGQGVWMGSDELSPNDTIRKVLKNATLSIGFCGLAETLIALTGKHHGENEDSQRFGLEIVQHLRDKTDKFKVEEKMNWSTFSTPAEGTANTFQKANRKDYGIIRGVTDRLYITNSFHVPVYYKIRAIDKIRIEAPYHEKCDAGAISYIEYNGDPLQNVEAFEKLVRAMHDANMGYFSVNHPVDRDPVCGYTGIIKNECPHCKRKEHESWHHKTVPMISI